VDSNIIYGLHRLFNWQAEAGCFGIIFQLRCDSFNEEFILVQNHGWYLWRRLHGFKM